LLILPCVHWIPVHSTAYASAAWVRGVAYSTCVTSPCLEPPLLIPLATCVSAVVKVRGYRGLSPLLPFEPPAIV